MTRVKIDLLEAEGFCWEYENKREQKWHEMYAALKQFKKENGHCNVPKKCRENQKLGSWVDYQRTLYRQTTTNINTNTKRNNNNNNLCGSSIEVYNPNAIAPERIQLLEKIGFRWSTAKELVATSNTMKRHPPNDNTDIVSTSNNNKNKDKNKHRRRVHVENVDVKRNASPLELLSIVASEVRSNEAVNNNPNNNCSEQEEEEEEQQQQQRNQIVVSPNNANTGAFTARMQRPPHYHYSNSTGIGNEAILATQRGHHRVVPLYSRAPNDRIAIHQQHVANTNIAPPPQYQYHHQQHQRVVRVVHHYSAPRQHVVHHRYGAAYSGRY